MLRDLKRRNAESEQSYSERQIYQAALERLAREVAALESITEEQASLRLEEIMGVPQLVNELDLDDDIEMEEEKEAA